MHSTNNESAVHDEMVRTLLVNELLRTAGQWVYYTAILKTLRQMKDTL
jgi:hypothetical protein